MTNKSDFIKYYVYSIKCNFVAYSYNHCDGIICEDSYDEYTVGKDGVIEIFDNSAYGFFTIIKDNESIDTYRPMEVIKRPIESNKND